MIILTIVLVAGLQSIIFYLLRKRKTFFIQTLIFVIDVFFLLKVLPPYFIPEPNFEGVDCGMHSLMIYVVFFVLGFSSVLTIFILFLLHYFKTKNIEQTHNNS